MHNGIKAYMKQHGDTVAGKKVEIILRDTLIRRMVERTRMAIIIVEQHARLALGLTRDAIVLERGRVVFRSSSELLLNACRPSIASSESHEGAIVKLNSRKFLMLLAKFGKSGHVTGFDQIAL